MSAPAQPSPDPLVPEQPAKIEYDRLTAYFDKLVKYSLLAITIILSIAAAFLWKNTEDVKNQAAAAIKATQDSATREISAIGKTAEATARVEAQTAIDAAFERQNVQKLVEAAAEKKVGTVTDKLIDQQVRAKLQPIEQRITLVGRMSEAESRARLGFRSGFDELANLVAGAKDPDTSRFGKASLDTLRTDYETRTKDTLTRFGQKGTRGLDLFLANINNGTPEPSIPTNLHGVVQAIDHHPDLNVVAAGFFAFRDETGDQVKMFDFEAVHTWCSQNKPKCQ